MKKLTAILGLALLGAASVATAALPFSDSFGSTGPNAGWSDADTFTGGVLTTVTTHTDHRSVTINPPPGNTDGFFGRMQATTAAAGTRWFLAGEATDTAYTIQTKIYGPVVNGADGDLDGFWYQGIVFYRNVGGYGRLHFQFNTNTAVLANGPRLRVQTSTGGLTTDLLLDSTTSPALVPTEGWYTVKLAFETATPRNFTLTLTPPTGSPIIATGSIKVAHDPTGTFGIFTYHDAAGDRSTYFDDFSAISTAAADVTDWMAYE